MTFKRYPGIALLWLAASAAAQDLVDTRSMMCFKGREALDHRGLREACVSRFPGMGSAIEEAHAAWAQRNEAVLSQFDAACEERLSTLQHRDQVGYETLQSLGRQFRDAAQAEMRADADLESRCRHYAESAGRPGDLDVPASIIQELLVPAAMPSQSEPQKVIPQVGDGRPAGLGKHPDPVMVNPEPMTVEADKAPPSHVMQAPLSVPLARTPADDGPKDPRARERCQKIIDEWQSRPENRGREPLRNDC
jgi:hypothetical protein